ncbi:hypothetical protein CSB20_12970, partial [bacterium DOLZORAL124_64_63]
MPSRVGFAIVLLLLSCGTTWAEPLTRILTTADHPLLLPAFHDADKAGIEIQDLFAELPVCPGPRWPTPGGPWRNMTAADGLYRFEAPAQGARVRYLVSYLTADQWQQATLKVRTDLDISLTLDDQPLSLEAGAEDGWQSAELKLPQGKSRLAAKVLLAADSERAPALELAVEPAEGATVTAGTERAHSVGIRTILNAPRVSDVAISPDGRFTALSLGEYRDGTNRETWLEIRKTADLELVRYFRGDGAPAPLTWAPGRDQDTALTWATNHDGKSTIWLFNLARGEVRPVLEDVADLGRWEWTPDGRSLIYEVRRDTDPDPRRVKHVAHPADRQPWWRGRAHLMQAYLDGRPPRRLTAGPLNPEGWQIAPDGTRLIFLTSEGDWTHRPFHISRLWELDLKTLRPREILSDPWISGAVYSPDGRTLCLTGSPSAFGGLGRNLPDGVQPNDYGGQLYLLDLDDRKPRPVSVDFVPDVGWTHWSPADGRIYARCTDTQHSNIYSYDPRQDRWR